MLKEMDSMRMMASRTRPGGKRAVKRLAAPWVAGVEVEIKKKKKIRGRLSPQIMYLPFPGNGARKLVGIL